MVVGMWRLPFSFSSRRKDREKKVFVLSWRILGILSSIVELVAGGEERKKSFSSRCKFFFSLGAG